MTESDARALGNRLREVRKRQRLTLEQVDARSGREFTQAALGAYERGDRVISVPRLQRLAALYGVPIDELLPAGLRPDDGRAVIDLRGPGALGDRLAHVERTLLDLAVEVRRLRDEVPVVTDHHHAG